MTLVTIIKDSNFTTGTGRFVTIVSGTEIVKPNALSEDTDYRVYLY